jgi:hypothetical protein
MPCLAGNINMQYHRPGKEELQVVVRNNYSNPSLTKLSLSVIFSQEVARGIEGKSGYVRTTDRRV